MMTARRACLWVVALHAIVAIVHNQAHQEINVALSTLQNTFAVVVIVAAPVLAAAIIWRGRPHSGATMLVISLLGSLIFGVANHFMIDSPDQLAHISTNGWGQVFIVSAYALALTELVGVLAGTALLRSSGRTKPAV